MRYLGSMVSQSGFVKHRAKRNGENLCLAKQQPPTKFIHYIHVHTYTKILITLLEYFWQTKLFEFFLTALGSIQARAVSSGGRGAVRPKENGKKWGSTPRFSNLSFVSYTAVCPAPKSSPGGQFLETALIQATLHWYRLNLPKFLFTIFI